MGTLMTKPYRHLSIAELDGAYAVFNRVVDVKLNLPRIRAISFRYVEEDNTHGTHIRISGLTDDIVATAEKASQWTLVDRRLKQENRYMYRISRVMAGASLEGKRLYYGLDVVKLTYLPSGFTPTGVWKEFYRDDIFVDERDGNDVES